MIFNSSNAQYSGSRITSGYGNISNQASSTIGFLITIWRRSQKDVIIQQSTAEEAERREGTPILKGLGCSSGNCEENSFKEPTSCFCQRGLKCFHPKEVPILKQ